ncbi:radical SAM protein [Desulfogranum japonicum]|uniref:radical SAM protein n=1 Tax=Desulfogranum japonicum TaxID=231447 RepID=UPI000416FAB4|nr:radical SAM protein [Desulfogranum japonicum]
MLRKAVLQETGTVHKKWTNRLPIALIYANAYPVAASNLGLQIVYTLLNRRDDVVCERFVYPSAHEPLVSLESGRPLQDFPIVCGSISFEEDYPRMAALLAAGRIPPFHHQRGSRIAPGDPLVILGGVAVFMNPEPLAPFADLMVIGEAEDIINPLVDHLQRYRMESRATLTSRVAAGMDGIYAPSHYSIHYNHMGQVERVTPANDVPQRVKKVVQKHPAIAGHSTILSREAELGMYMVELGRGCSRGCRFCAAGYIYRAPRLWQADSILKALEDRPEGVDTVGLLGMEMTPEGTLDQIADFLSLHQCRLSFSSLRADHISPRILDVLAHSKLKSVAIAPDGASERLRTVINKGLRTEDLRSAASRLCEAGIYNLKLYIMIGLPTETADDLDELVELIQNIHGDLLAIGKARGRLTEITLSVNSFVPKPWTAFQYASFGGLEPEVAQDLHAVEKAILALKGKIKYLRRALSKLANVRIKTDHPERVYQQAVFARADRRIAPILLDLGMGKYSFKQAVRRNIVEDWQYAIRPRTKDELLCWEIIDHGIHSAYLWKEYEKSMAGKSTPPCRPSHCRRCGVCQEGTSQFAKSDSFGTEKK